MRSRRTWPSSARSAMSRGERARQRLRWRWPGCLRRAGMWCRSRGRRRRGTWRTTQRLPISCLARQTCRTSMRCQQLSARATEQAVRHRTGISRRRSAEACQPRGDTVRLLINRNCHFYELHGSAHVWRHLVLLSSAAALVAFAIQPAEAGTGGEQPPAGVVKPTPPTNLPHLPANTPQVQQIRQIVQCGGTMYAVGTFSTIRKGSTTFTRNNVFSFKATAPYTVTSWAPNVVGTYGTTSNPSNTVNTIAFVGGNCANAYIGGHFSSINGTAVKNIAEISTTTGNVVKTFASNASGAVQTLVGTHARLITGGNFTGINGDPTDPYLVSLNPTTGKSDGYLHLHVSANYQFPGVSQNATHIYAAQLSHGGHQILLEGDFTSVGGQARQQAFIINISGTTGVVTGWNAPDFTTNCAPSEPFYVQDGAWSPNDSTVYFGTTGYHPLGGPTGSTPRTGPCDAALAYPSTPATVSALWTNYTG